MELIIFLPALVILFAMVLWPPEKVFTNFYLPILLLIPQIFVFHINRVPEISFAQAAILPLFAIGFIMRLHYWKWSLSDLIIALFLIEMTYSEYTAEGLGSTAQMLSNALTGMIFPYILAKQLIYPTNYTLSVAKKIVTLMVLNVLLSVYEQRFMVNPYIQLFQYLLPSQGFDWPSLDRYGLARISGPFVQPILFAIACGIGLFFNHWIAKNNYWSKHYQYIPDLPISKGRLYSILLGMGLVLTFSRGPLLAVCLGFLFVGIGTAKNPWRSFIMRMSFFIVASLIVSEVYDYYAEIGTELATSDQERTLSYRTNLVKKYEMIAWQQPWFGWGVSSWPKLAYTVSIDNQFLWLTLKHGFLATGLYIFLMLNICIRLLIRGFKLPLTYQRERTLNFTFLGSYLAVIFSFITVFMGLQLEPLFFILTGWIEGYLLSSFQSDEGWDRANAPKKVVSRA